MNIVNIFQGLAFLAWLAVFALLVVLVVRSGRNQPTKGAGKILLIVVGVAILLTVISAGLVFVNPQERAVVISAIQPDGYRQEALQPGLTWIVPFVESTVRYPISKQTYTMSATQDEGQIVGDDSITARTADGQEVFVDASVIYSLDPAKVVQTHIIWQDRIAGDLVRPLSRGIIRDAVSKFGVEEVYSTKRVEMVNMIEEEMATRLEENGVVLSDFVLRNITFSPEYAASIEQKQIAEQLVQQAVFVVQQREQEAEQARKVAAGKADAVVIAAQGDAEARLIQADAEAKSLELIADAIRGNPDLLTFEYITKLSPNIQAMLLPNNAPFLFPLPDINNLDTTPELTPTPVPNP